VTRDEERAVHIAKIVAEAPPLSDETRNRLRAILAGHLVAADGIGGGRMSRNVPNGAGMRSDPATTSAVTSGTHTEPTPDEESHLHAIAAG
jgi:hypothetical protein